MSEYETIEAMAKDRGMSVDKFRQMMNEQYGLAPPDDNKSVPNSPVMAINPLNPDQARKAADTLRRQLLEEILSEGAMSNIAERLASCVSIYGDVNERASELLEGGPYERRQERAAKAEYMALRALANEKQITALHADPISGAALTVAKLHRCQYLGNPIDHEEMKAQMAAQIKALKSTRASREERLAALAIMSEHCGQAIINEAANAPTADARAIVLERASNVFERASRQVERLHKLNQVPSHLIVRGDGHNIAHNQQIVQNRGQPNQLLEENDAGRRDTTKLESKTPKSPERVDVPKQTVVKKHGSKNHRRKS